MEWNMMEEVWYWMVYDVKSRWEGVGYMMVVRRTEHV
jgi:hypothetical protein